MAEPVRTVGIIICGIPKGTEHKYRCPHCEFESDDLEQFATTMCWNCVYGIQEEPDGPDFEDATTAQLDPCEVCGEYGSCAVDSEGRPLIHVPETPVPATAEEANNDEH